MRDLNKAIIWENHKPQTVEEIAHQLAGAVVFMKADALKAFLQVHLTEESSKLLVINTHLKADTESRECPLEPKCHRMYSR